ncbi:MAG: preprotein translocase subunit YajC [Clostridiales bacterium]|nr:preprotein translocase subunit YajC [Clostridiales bacterium]
MLLNLLAESGATNGNTPTGNNDWIIWVVLLGMLALLIVYNYFTGKKRRQQAEAEKEKRNAIKAGYKIMTIGGITGTVVSVDDEANTFVLATGSEENPSYITFDKVAIYSAEDPNAVTEEVADVEEDSSIEEQTEEVLETTEEITEETEEKAE